MTTVQLSVGSLSRGNSGPAQGVAGSCGAEGRILSDVKLHAKRRLSEDREKSAECEVLSEVECGRV